MRHPGTVELVDAESGEVLQTRSADELGEGAWANDEHGVRTPIVRVLLKETEDRRELISLGPEGQFLSSTVARRSPGR